MCELTFVVGVCFGILIGIFVNIVMDRWFMWKKEVRESYKGNKDD